MADETPITVEKAEERLAAWQQAHPHQTARHGRLMLRLAISSHSIARLIERQRDDLLSTLRTTEQTYAALHEAVVAAGRLKGLARSRALAQLAKIAAAPPMEAIDFPTFPPIKVCIIDPDGDDQEEIFLV